MDMTRIKAMTARMGNANEALLPLMGPIMGKVLDSFTIYAAEGVTTKALEMLGLLTLICVTSIEAYGGDTDALVNAEIGRLETFLNQLEAEEAMHAKEA